MIQASLTTPVPPDALSNNPLSALMGLAIPASSEPICDDAYPTFDHDAIDRLCPVWAKVGKAILLRRQTQ